MKTDEEKRNENWLHWARMPAWTHREASALVAGIIPADKWSHEGLSRNAYSFGEELNTRYFRIWELLLREETIYRINFPIELRELLDWAERSHIDIAEKFLIALFELNRLPLSDHELTELDAKSPENQELGTRERETLLYLIGTMAVLKYGFNPKKRNSAATAILKDMTEIGLERMSEDTVRNKLKEASDLIPQSYFSKDEKGR
jgi:hypothetical protein